MRYLQRGITMFDVTKENNVLQEFIRMAPYIPLFIDEPVSVAITNKTAFIYNQPCEELPVSCELGEPFPEGNTPSMVMKSGEAMTREVSAKVYGIPFKSYAIPIRDNNEIVGCLMIAKSITVIKQSKKAVSDLSEEVSQITDVINEITEGVQKSSENTHEVNRLIEELLKETEKMNDIIASINKLSNSTKILGINASIEASRAGVAGRGFSIVAKEIERLSDRTNQSSALIGDILASIDNQLNTIGGKSQETTDTFMQQAAALQEIAASMDELNSNVKVVDDYMKQL